MVTTVDLNLPSEADFLRERLREMANAPMPEIRELVRAASEYRKAVEDRENLYGSGYRNRTWAALIAAIDALNRKRWSL